MSAFPSPSNDEEAVAQMAQLTIEGDKPSVEDKGSSPSTSETDNQDTNEQQSGVEMVNPALDAVILAALRKPQDRIFLLKLDLEFENFINNPQRVRLDFPQMNSYQRLIVHRVATYFKLTHLFDPVRRSIYLCKNVSTEIPVVRFSDLIEKEEEPITTAPKFQIMRRLSSGRGHRKGDVSPSDSNLSSDSKSALDRKQMTLEERKVAYEEARARIFQDFESNSGEGSEVEAASQPSSSTGSPAIKAAVEKKGSGTSTPDESPEEPTAGMSRNLSNRGKQFAPRTQTNSKRPPPRDKETTTDATNSYPRMDNRFTAQAQPFLPSQPSPYQPSPYASQQPSPAYNNSRNNSPFGYPTTPYSNTPLYDPYNANLVQPNNPNFANYWKPQRPQTANSTSIPPSMSAAGPSSQQHPSQPLSRVWNPNTNTSAEPWGLQDFTPSPYVDNMRVWSTRPDNRDWGPLW
ncbi:hypothetical protein K450DRAFT_231688 [Umbelopsis ramanniana AG]|uniref:SUZ domain-containing protein n=1 Tax=Umbelopsis ramanniana AG TaxID=1314678 RepID=A0AAD5ECP8_UMBRA|nr:uncharacterized protein K450DRAFT_231688 [Umbelopsis ramanniana AG]KAI8581518.1 hypothetical protein K450DRAFT_231688 [Umbelopsis ramanniana AG]